MGRLAIERMQEMMEHFEVIGDVRGRGCLFGMELVLDRETREPATDLADRVLYAAATSWSELQNHDGQCAHIHTATDCHFRTIASGNGHCSGKPGRSVVESKVEF